MAPVVILTIQFFILSLNVLDTAIASNIQLASRILVIMIFLSALPIVINRSKIKLIAIYFTFIFVFLLHYLLYPDNSIYLRSLILPLFFMCLPVFIYTLSIRDWYEFKTTMEKASYIIFLFGVVLGGLIFTGKATIGSYSMSFSYYMLLPTIIFLNKFLDKLSLQLFIITLVSLLIILSFGSRGPILCVAVFIFLKLIRPGTQISFRKAIGYLVVTVIGFSGLIFYNRIFESIYDLLLLFGIKSRNITLLLNEGVHWSGRDLLYENVIKEIIENPIMGIGLAGDRGILGGRYVHNFFIEVIANFGFIMGGILLIAFLLLVLKSLIQNNRVKYNMIIIWLCIGFIPLMVSGSYLTSMNFWIFLALILNGLFIRNKSNMISKDEVFYESIG